MEKWHREDSSPSRQTPGPWLCSCVVGGTDSKRAGPGAGGRGLGGTWQLSPVAWSWRGRGDHSVRTSDVLVLIPTKGAQPEVGT